MKLKKISLAGVLVALYVATTVINPLGYGILQLRVSEIIAVLPFWDRKYAISCTLGVVIANIFSPLSFFDVLTGLIIAVIAYTLLVKLPHKWQSCLTYALLCGALVGLEIKLVAGISWWISFCSISLSQVIICALAIPLLNQLRKTGLI